MDQQFRYSVALDGPHLDGLITNPSLTLPALSEWALSHVPPRREAA